MHVLVKTKLWKKHYQKHIFMIRIVSAKIRKTNANQIQSTKLMEFLLHINNNLLLYLCLASYHWKRIFYWEKNLLRKSTAAKSSPKIFYNS